jgi:hypothetical protein
MSYLANTNVKELWGFTQVTKKDSIGDTLRWNVYGWVSSPMDDPNEPLRVFSPHADKLFLYNPLGCGPLFLV